MMARRLSVAILAGVAATAIMGLAAGPARAAAPRDQGWWTVTNPGVAPPGVALPAAAPTVGPPDVPGRGLLVQGGPNGPTAVAALLYELDPGTGASTLTLAVAPNSITTPKATLQVCRLLQAIAHPEQGGPMADAPPYDCSRKVTAAPEADGKSYKFAVADLVSDQLVAVAILPAGPTDRVVFNAPDDSSLTTGGSSSPASPSVDAGTIGGPTDTGAAPPADALSGTGSTPSVDLGVPGVGATGPSTVSPAPAAIPARRAASGAFVPVVSQSPEAATPLLVVLLVVGALGGMSLWMYSGRQQATEGAPA
ncbi:MAG TPA: hypothetical protein VG076_04615 [Acidimicrobiales bacterium]|nr:hypothetical protein [Acidimicrobiales bacterium]